MLSETWRSACDSDTIGRCQRSFDCFFVFCFLFSRYWDANVSHINAVSHSAPGVSGHVCEHTPTLCAQCAHTVDSSMHVLLLTAVKLLPQTPQMYKL